MADDFETNPSDQYLNYSQPALPIEAQTINLGGVAVTNVNGVTGPAITFTGGTSGFGYTTDGISIISLVSPLTTKGDLYTHNGSAGIRLPVGANGEVLTADSGVSAGVKWAAGGASSTDSLPNMLMLMGA